jgi:hypothetical protein
MHPKAKNYLLVLLTAATASSGYLAWQQSQRLDALQTELSKASVATAAVKPRHTTPPAAPTPAVADAPSAPVTEASAPADAPAASNAPRPRGGNRPDFAALMATPEFVQAMNLQHRAALDGRYADLFKKLQLSPDALEKLKTLLVERQATRVDVMNSARAQGLDPRTNRDEINKLTAQAQAEIDASIKGTLGEAVYNQYQNYETSLPQRGLVSQLDLRLSYSGTPLNSTQTEFLVKALAASPANSAPADSLGGFGPRPSAVLSDAVIQQAKSVLTPDQVAALKQLQAEQKAQQQVRDLMRTPPKDPASR